MESSSGIFVAWSWSTNLTNVIPPLKINLFPFQSIPIALFPLFLALRDIYLMFRAMDHSQDGYLSKEEFCRFFEYANHAWTPLLTVPQKPWPFFKEFGLFLLRFLNSKYSDYIFSKLMKQFPLKMSIDRKCRLSPCLPEKSANF